MKSGVDLKRQSSSFVISRSSVRTRLPALLDINDLRSLSRDRVLEIGTGSGYQAAVLSWLVAEVYTIEIIEPLAKRAGADLKAARIQQCKSPRRRWLSGSVMKTFRVLLKSHPDPKGVEIVGSRI